MDERGSHHISGEDYWGVRRGQELEPIWETQASVGEDTPLPSQ